MPLLIIIGIIIFMASRKPKRNKVNLIPVYTKELERIRREQERQVDRQRKEIERAAKERKALEDRQRKEHERRIKEAEKAEKEAREREQALEDIQFYHTQIKRHREMLNDAEKQLNQVRKELSENEEIDSIAPGAVSEKVLEKQRRERDKLTKRVITLENQIHSMETKLGKAYYKANI